jgi:hypothetical protein
MPTNYLSDNINNETVLATINSAPIFLDKLLLSGDNLRVVETYVFDDIKGVRRNSIGGYLSFVYDGEAWTADMIFPAQETQIVDKGIVQIID